MAQQIINENCERRKRFVLNIKTYKILYYIANENVLMEMSEPKKNERYIKSGQTSMFFFTYAGHNNI